MLRQDVGVENHENQHWEVWIDRWKRALPIYSPVADNDQARKKVRPPLLSRLASNLLSSFEARVLANAQNRVGFPLEGGLQVGELGRPLPPEGCL